MDKINKIQQDLITELGLDSISQEKKQALAGKMAEVLLKKIFFELTSKLSDQDRTVYEEMVEKKESLKEMGKFFKDKISNYDELVEKIISDFKVEMGNK